MTVAGLAAMMAGFGYLLQYSFDNFLGPSAKLELSALIGVAVIVGAARLHRRNERMRDYASALIGLGVTILYLCCYFAGPYFGLVVTSVTFVLYATTVGIAYALALAFHTRVVAVVTLLGGVLAPWLVTEAQQIEDVYPVFAVLLTAASLHLARRLRWEVLVQLTFLATAALQTLVADVDPDAWISCASANAHFYLFVCFLLFDGRRATRELTQGGAAVLVGVLVLFVLIATQALTDDDALGVLFVVNAAFIVAPFFLPIVGGGGTRAVFVLSGGVLLGYGILSLTNVDYLGFLWVLEGLALLYVGMRYHTALVRYEGLAALGLGSLSALLVIGEWFLDGEWVYSSAWLTIAPWWSSSNSRPGGFALRPPTKPRANVLRAGSTSYSRCMWRSGGREPCVLTRRSSFLCWPLCRCLAFCISHPYVALVRPKCLA
jgi:uncharacterized membrane protein